MAWQSNGTEELVQRVKQLQRSDPEGKLCWMSYVQRWGVGKNDPGAYDSKFLLDFFDQHEAGQIEVDDSLRYPYEGGGVEVYVGKLPEGVTQAEIRAYFEGWGQVLRVDLKQDRNFAFVALADEAMTDEVVNCTEHLIQDAWVEIRRAGESGGKGGKGGKGKGGGGKGKGGKGKGGWGGDDWGKGGGGKGKGGGGKGKGKGGKDKGFGGKDKGWGKGKNPY